MFARSFLTTLSFHMKLQGLLIVLLKGALCRNQNWYRVVNQVMENVRILGEMVIRLGQQQCLTIFKSWHHLLNTVSIVGEKALHTSVEIICKLTSSSSNINISNNNSNINIRSSPDPTIDQIQPVLRRHVLLITIVPLPPMEEDPNYLLLIQGIITLLLHLTSITIIITKIIHIFHICNLRHSSSNNNNHHHKLILMLGVEIRDLVLLVLNLPKLDEKIMLEGMEA